MPATPFRRPALLLKRSCCLGAIGALIAAGSLGCSRGDEADEPVRTTAAPAPWTARLDDECSDLDEQFDHLAVADPSSVDEAVTYADDVDAFAEALVALLDVAVDDDGHAEVSPLRAAAVELEAATSRLSEGALAGDAVAVDAATAEVNGLTPVINELAAELGLSSCGGF